jgi:hypothetical protein
MVVPTAVAKTSALDAVMAPKRAVVVSLRVHIPPLTLSLYMPKVPKQRLETPTIAPTVGRANTLIVAVLTLVPQLLVTVAEMVAVPAALPVMTPLPEIVAIEASEELHVRPVAMDALQVTLAPTQTESVPDMVLLVGKGNILMI